MHSAIETVVRKLVNYPETKYAVEGDAITIYPSDENGFEVALLVASEFIVSAGVWHEHFAAESEALDCFAFLLSDSCRLKIAYKGDKATTWTIESYDNEQWNEYSTTGIFTLNFWSPTRIEFFQNRIIKSRD